MAEALHSPEVGHHVPATHVRRLEPAIGRTPGQVWERAVDRRVVLNCSAGTLQIRMARPELSIARPESAARSVLDTTHVSNQVSRVHWLGQVDDQLVRDVHSVVCAVVELGGAVGWLATPTRDDVAQWLGDWSEAAATGRAAFALGRVDGAIQAVGGWKAGPQGPSGHVVELTKIMVHPDERGHGLGRLVVDALIDSADNFGAELLTLGVRGNNHGAQALYEACGFTTWGVLPNGVAVGEHRFDLVRMCRQLRLPANTQIHGSTAGGLGGSAHHLR